MLRKIACGFVAGDFLVLDFLAGTDECQIESGRVLLILRDDFVPFCKKAHHTFAGLRASRYTKKFQTFLICWGFMNAPISHIATPAYWLLREIDIVLPILSGL